MKLTELFREKNGAPIEWNGKTVHMMYEMPVIQTPAILRISFVKVSSERPEALRLKAHKGQLDVNGQLLDDVVLWSDTSPQTIDVAAKPSTKKMTVRAWNAWRDSIGVMQAWIGNAGIVVDESASGGVVLRCSDGYGDPAFDDLVVELTIMEPEP